MNYQPKLEAYPHQLEALERMKGRKAFALLMFMRTGKTKTLLDNFGGLELAGEVSDMLVIAPAGVYRTWEKAIDEHVSVDLRSRLAIYTWISSKKAGKELAARAAFLKFTGPRVLLMNIEALSTVQDARAMCETFLRDKAKGMIVIDESTIIKNPSAKRTKYINNRLAFMAEYRRILTGLPTPRSPLDLFSQFYFLNWRILGFTNYYSFRSRYAIMQKMPFGGRNVDVVVGYRNVEELQNKIEPCSYRVMFRPEIPSTYTVREIELTPEQKRVYTELKKFATARLNETSHVTATIVISQILRLHQVLTGHVVDELGQMHEIPENRTASLLELLEEYSGKAIIWCSYNHSVNKVVGALRKEYGANSVARFWGGNVATREEEEKAFLSNPECRFMVATPGAGGRGRTWSNADLVVYYSSSNDLEHRDQSEQRAQGFNKKRQVDYVDMIAPGTVEEKILQALRKKINMAASITGDDWRDWVI